MCLLILDKFLRPELNLFAVQMVSQSQFFRDFYLFSLMRFPLCWKNVRNFKQNFAQKEGTRCKYFIMRLPCKNRQVHLHRLFSKALEMQNRHGWWGS